MPQVQREIFIEQLQHYRKHRLSNQQNIELCKVLKSGRIAAISLQDDLENVKLQQSVERGAIARDRLVVGNIGLCIKGAQKYGRGMEIADMIQQGAIGLIRALKTFDPDRGNQLSTYASPWIRQAITRARQTTGRTVALPIHIYDLVSKIKTAEAALSSKHNRKPTRVEIAEKSGISVGKINWAISQIANIFSLDASASTNKGGFIDTSFLDVIESPCSSQMEVLEHLETLDTLHTGIRLLDERDREIVTLKYGMRDDKPMASRAIAVRLGIKDKDVSVRLRHIKQRILERQFPAMIPIGIKIATEAIDTFRAKNQIVAVLKFKGCMDIGRLKTTFNAWSEDDIKKVLAALEDEGKVRSYPVMHDEMGRQSKHGITKWEAVK